jgi:hypothetical protein
MYQVKAEACNYLRVSPFAYSEPDLESIKSAVSSKLVSMLDVHDVARVSRSIKVRSSAVPGHKQTSVKVRGNRVKAFSIATSPPPYPVNLYSRFRNIQLFDYI